MAKSESTRRRVVKATDRCKQGGGNWAVWSGGTRKFNEKTSFNTQVSADNWKSVGVAANVAYDIVPGFIVTADAGFCIEAQLDRQLAPTMRAR